MGEEKKDKTLKNPTEEFLEEFEQATMWYGELLGKLEILPFAPRDRALLAGLAMGLSNQFIRLNKKLVEWGFLHGPPL